MLPRKPRTPITLHEPRRGVPIAVEGRLNTNVAGALLHDDAEDDALFDANLGALEDGVPDATDIRAGVARREHGRLVGVEDFLKCLPLAHGREVGGGSGVGSEAHVGGVEVLQNETIVGEYLAMLQLNVDVASRYRTR